MFFTRNLLGSLTVALFVLLASGSALPLPGSTTISSFEIGFFADKIRIEYAPEMVISAPTKLDNGSIDRALNTLSRRSTDVLLNSLLQQKKAYQLNDFLFYKLARNSVAAIYEGKMTTARELTLFTLLSRAGYDVRLTYRDKRAYLNVYTEEELFEVPIIDHDGRAYANITCLNGSCKSRQSLYIYRQRPNPNGRSFGFKLHQWPKLTPKPVEKKLSFSYHGMQTELDVTFDQTTVDIMSDYPFIHEYAYLETPLSTTLSNTLLPKLRRMLNQLSSREQLELLASFTRSAFVYKEDNEYFGRSKPMVPEELFSYAYSDCEDRSALFFALARDLLDVPMAVVAYDDHLTIAVASDDISGDSFDYQGRRYIFCDPTGPSNSSRIGEIPPGYERKSFQIIGQHK